VKHLSHVGALSGRGKNLYPAHYRQAFASWDILFRLHHLLASRPPYLFRGVYTGFQVPYRRYWLML